LPSSLSVEAIVRALEAAIELGPDPEKVLPILGRRLRELNAAP
jgi:hypothetical protein